MTFKGIEGNLTFIVLDGVGERKSTVGNAIKNAKMPVFNRLKKEFPFRTLQAHGKAVGMPSDSDMGNSEVGHNALGAGQIYDQGAKLVQNAIDSGRLYEGSGWTDIKSNVLKHNSTLHFMGLVSDGNVHSHLNHLLDMIEKAAEQGVRKIRIHALLDGRDVGETSALDYVSPLENKLAELRSAGVDAYIASGGGRMTITMDRYGANWKMVERGWNTHVHGDNRRFSSTEEAILTYRKEGQFTDQFLPGFVIEKDNQPLGPIRDNDSIIFFNFRGDRAIEISMAFEGGGSFSHFDRGKTPKVVFAGMMEYDGDLHLPARYLVQPPEIKNTLGERLVEQGVTQYALSETQKYGHVTYFWNGNRSGKFSDTLETYVEIPSDELPFETRPWMKAGEISDTLIQAIQSKQHRFLRVNYPNGDMVGHSGDYLATEVAMTCLDQQLGRVLNSVRQTGGVAMITADHGNADEMYMLDKEGTPLIDDTGTIKPKTSHTLSPVPFILFDPHKQIHASLDTVSKMGLSHIAASIAEILGVEPHPEWDASLLQWPT